MKVNNVNVDRIAQEAKAISADKPKGMRLNKIEVKWNTDPSRPQMQATVKYERGEMVMECDSPSFMGGEGRMPGPLNYCIMGFASCFTGSLASAATVRNVHIRQLTMSAECQMDFSRVFGLSDEPAVRGVTFTIDMQSDADKATMEQLTEEALSRCPGIFVLRNPIQVSAVIK